MKRTILLAVLVPLGLAGSCPRNQFELVMERTPDGRVQRNIAYWVEEDGESRPPDGDELARVEALYASTATQDGAKRRVSGEFGPSLPSDLQHEGLENHGFLAQSTDLLGSVYTYSERMPGLPRPMDAIRAADRAVDLAMRALCAAVECDPAWQAKPEERQQIIEFVQGELRDDAENVLLMIGLTCVRMAAMADAASGVEPDSEVMETWNYGEGLRIAEFLVERGYLRADELPTFANLQADLTRGAVRKLAATLGYPGEDAWPAELRRLADPKEGVAELERLVEAGATALGFTKDDIGAALAVAIPRFLAPSLEGTVVWRGPEPIRTNGVWDAEAGVLRWHASGRSGCMPPQHLFAIWAEPDEAFQTAHFGTVLLRGKGLLKHFEWRRNLSAANRAQWDEFLESRVPGPHLADELRGFRFSSDQAQPSNAPVQGTQLLLDSLP